MADRRAPQSGPVQPTGTPKDGPPSPGPVPSDLAVAALQALHALASAVAEQAGMSGHARERLELLMVPAPLYFSPHALTTQGAEDATRLLQLVEQRVRTALEGKRAWREGHVYCFRCDAPDCPHSRPSHQGDVFAGYSPTGLPAWQSFVNLCIDAEDDRVDLLYEDLPEVIARLQTASTLHEKLLPAFQKDTLEYRILGQVVAGLVPVDLQISRWRPTPGVARVALTIQILEIRSAIEVPRLRLNLLGLTSAELLEAAATAQPQDAAERLRRHLSGLRQKLETLSRSAAHAERMGKPLELEATLLGLLNKLKDELERIFRPDPHRTGHARMRHLSRTRPTSNALADVETAPFDRYYMDVERGTVVILGPKGRTHLFSPDGRHVTSLQLVAGELERKVQKTRWVPLERTLSVDVRARIRALSPARDR